MAARTGNEEIVRLLLGKGADIYYTDEVTIYSWLHVIWCDMVTW